MRPVIRVSLNGRALQLEDDAHALLTQYLEAAARALDGNPDRAEIIADLEQSIADKSARFLGGGRDVLDRGQVSIVLDEVGPVEPVPNGLASTAGAESARASTSAPTGRLYQVSEGAIISGVCNGLGKWLNVDVTIVRIVAVVLAFVTGGAAVVAYLLLMLILPYASGPGATQGLPRASRSFVERLRGQTAEFARSEEWRGFHADVRRTWERAQARVQREWAARRRSGGVSVAGAGGGADGTRDASAPALIAHDERRDEFSASPAPSHVVVLALIVLLIAVLALG